MLNIRNKICRERIQNHIIDCLESQSQDGTKENGAKVVISNMIASGLFENRPYFRRSSFVTGAPAPMKKFIDCVEGFDIWTCDRIDMIRYCRDEDEATVKKMIARDDRDGVTIANYYAYLVSRELPAALARLGFDCSSRFIDEWNYKGTYPDDWEI